MAVGVDRRHDPGHLVDASDDAGRQLVEPGIDGVTLLRSERPSSFEERNIGADAACVDLRVEQQQAAFFRQERPQERTVVGCTRRTNVLLAALQQKGEITLAGGGVFRVLTLLCGLRPGQTQHCLPRLRALAIGQTKRFAAQTKLGRIGVRER